MTKVTLYYYGSEPGGLEGIDRSFKSGDFFEFDETLANHLLGKVRRCWFTEEEHQEKMKAKEPMIRKMYSKVLGEEHDS